MEDFEENNINNLIYKPTVWWRYVDDVFAIWPYSNETLNNFLNHINQKEPSIKFTIELEANNQLPFLDILVKKADNTYETSVYRKPTHTNRYLNFNSNQHTNIKKGVVKCLYDRAKIISSNDEILTNEKKFIKTVLLNNQYPESFVDRQFTNIENRINVQQVQQPQFNSTAVIPYVHVLSDKLRRIGNMFSVRTVFQTGNTLRSILSQTKPINEIQNSKNCIYSVPCECGKHYVGESGRPFAVRLAEHKNYARKGEFEKSKICDHAWNNNHVIKWDFARILEKESNNMKRKLKESAIILLNGDTCVSNQSVDFCTSWLPILKDEVSKNKITII